MSKIEKKQDGQSSLEWFTTFTLSLIFENEQLVKYLIEQCRDSLQYIEKFLNSIEVNNKRDLLVYHALLTLAKSICKNRVPLEYALLWLAGALDTMWVSHEIRGIKEVLEQLGFKPTEATIIRTPLDYPYDFVVIHDKTIYIVEITRSGKNVKEIVDKLLDFEWKYFCSREDVKIIIYENGKIIKEDFKKYCEKRAKTK